MVGDSAGDIACARALLAVPSFGALGAMLSMQVLISLILRRKRLRKLLKVCDDCCRRLAAASEGRGLNGLLNLPNYQKPLLTLDLSLKTRS